jgi:hypothetical protein
LCCSGCRKSCYGKCDVDAGKAGGARPCLEILLHIKGVLLVGVVTDFTVNLSAKDGDEG